MAWRLPVRKQGSSPAAGAASTDADDLVIRLCDTGLVDDDAVDNPVGISRPAVFQGKGDGPAIVG